MRNLLHIVFLFFCTLLLPAPGLRAQSVDAAEASHREFVRLRMNGADEDSYTALYKCYEEYKGVLAVSEAGSLPYSQAKNGLRDILPYLQAGAAYYSSHGDQLKALPFAQAYMDIPLMDAFNGEALPRDPNFPVMAYFAASGTFNAGDYRKAIPYFKIYLSTSDDKHRQVVYTYLAKSYLNLGEAEQAMTTLTEATSHYPTDFNMLSMGINSCIEREDNINLQNFLTKALVVKPDDETLLNIQGKLYEDTFEFQKALGVYSKLKGLKPNSLNIAKHIALNYYNLGVMNYNKASIEENESTAKKYSRQSKEFFSAATPALDEVLASDATSLKYAQALATCYSCLGDEDKLNVANARVYALGGKTVEMNTTPSLINYNSTASVSSVSAGDTPMFSAFAKPYVESRVNAWQMKDPYETLTEYQMRVTPQSREAKVQALLKEAEEAYIANYAKPLRSEEMILRPYDADHKVFLVESAYGELVVPVPRENNEAKVFESSWNSMQFTDPKYYVSNDKLLLSDLTFVTPTGKRYSFRSDRNLNYTDINLVFEPIRGDYTGSGEGSGKANRQTLTATQTRSDVDINIPETQLSNDRTFAVIISNENYSMVAHVPMALNDGVVFSQYCEKTLGIPQRNIRIYQDASYGTMLRAVRDIQDIAAAYNGDISVIFYYAGHGIPNEATKDAFLLPIDSDALQTEGCYSLGRLYSELGDMEANSVVVFLDACFSGATREGKMLASARGVALKAKPEEPKGKMVIFTAASDDETAFPYEEKGHGLFTYFLLKKLQESGGSATLGDLGDYVTTQVRQQSVVVNKKAQTPSVSHAGALGNDWRKMKLIPEKSR